MFGFFDQDLAFLWEQQGLNEHMAKAGKP